MMSTASAFPLEEFRSAVAAAAKCKFRTLEVARLLEIAAERSRMEVAS